MMATRSAKRFAIRPYMRRADRQALIEDILNRHTDGGTLDVLAASIDLQRTLLLAPSSVRRYITQRLRQDLQQPIAEAGTVLALPDRESTTHREHGNTSGTLARSLAVWVHRGAAVESFSAPEL